MTDTPIAYRPDGSPIYDNAATVAINLAFTAQNDRVVLIAVRRNNEPGKGKIALPGGFHMKGETWQQACTRELYEETGYIAFPSLIKQVGEVITDEYDHNLIFGLSKDYVTLDDNALTDGESETLLLDPFDLPPPEDWAFLLHYRAVRDHFAL